MPSIEEDLERLAHEAKNRKRALAVKDQINEKLDGWDTYPEERINLAVSVFELTEELARLEGWRSPE